MLHHVTFEHIILCFFLPVLRSDTGVSRDPDPGFVIVTGWHPEMSRVQSHVTGPEAAYGAS